MDAVERLAAVLERDRQDGRSSRWAGYALVAAYVAFFLGYFVHMQQERVRRVEREASRALHSSMTFEQHAEAHRHLDAAQASS